MKILNRNFFIGLVAGLILTILILIGGGYVLIRSFTSRTGGKIESILQPPPFPTQTRMDYNWRVQGLDGKELDVGKSKGKVPLRDLSYVMFSFWYSSQRV